MGISPSKESRGEGVDRKSKADATASLTEEEGSLTVPESSGKKKRKSSNSTPRKNGCKGQMTAENGASPAAPTPVSTHISDDQINVNLAMADLMAYLQVVATNSQNLPTTRRDNPELRKSEHTMTADEYARKSAAFIPADVRVIAGSFNKYGRVWDLPTSMEYTACDGAQEPGRSYGGACCNAMLKVLYDAANEAADAEQDAAATDSIFDDDEESLIHNPAEMSRTRTFESLVLGVVPPTITWATLLRKMKAEIQEIEYVQAPLVTATRKFDLNKPFSLVPEDFDPKKNTMRSLLIGCNYTDVAGAELKASHDDVRSMKDYIVNVHGFPEAKSLMTILLDDDEHKHPTHLNIVESLKAIAEQSQPGDVVFIQFSGHGGRVLDSVVSTEAETYDEAFAPSDYAVSGLIRDTLIYKILLAPMRYGVTVTMLLDTCDTGMVLDLPYEWTTKSDRRDTQPKMSTNDDFSFIRFLKVVKTLYESSTFTQLGMTVRSALQKPGDSSIDKEDSILEETPVNSMTAEQEEVVPQPPAEQNAILAALAACTSPKTMAECSGLGDESSPNKSKSTTQILDSTPSADGPNSLNLLEHVMTACTMNIDAEFSDEDMYHGRSAGDDDDTYGTDTLGETTTYESFTDDGYESNRRPRRRSRPRRSRGRFV